MPAMTPANPRFREFKDRLEGPEGCNFREEKPGDIDSLRWDCARDRSRPRSRRVLEQMGLTKEEIAESMEYFTAHGGYCDCEVVFNVNSEQERLRRVRRRNPRGTRISSRKRNPK